MNTPHNWIRLTMIAFTLWSGVAFAQNFEDNPQSRQDWRGHLELARKAYADGQFNSALIHYNNAKIGLPENLSIDEEIAQTQFRLKNLKGANEHYDKVENKEELARVQYNLGNVAMQQKEFQKAIDAYANALKLNPGDAQTKYNLSQALRAKAQQKNQPKQNDQAPQSPQNQNKNKDPKEQQDTSQNESDLPEDKVKKLLKELMKQEANTKRKLTKGQGYRRSPQTSKDW